MAENKTPAAALLLALLCSLLTGGAQLATKAAADQLRRAGWTDPHGLLVLFGAYALLGFGFVVFLLALRSGQLSVVYPILAARYVWVVAVTPLLFPAETWNAFKVAGAALAALGVALLARARAN